MLKEHRYGRVHLPLIFSVWLICILIISGIHAFLTYSFYKGLAAPEGRIPLYMVWGGVVVSIISLLAQFWCAVKAHLPPVALFQVNGLVAAGWIAIDVYFWFVDGGDVSPLVCGFSSTKYPYCEYNSLVLIEVAFTGVITIFTIYAAVLGLMKIEWKNSKVSANSQEVQVLLQEGRLSTNSAAHQLSPLKSPFFTTTELHENTIPERLTRVSRGRSIESCSDYAATAVEMPSTDPFDSKLQRLGLRHYSYFENQGSQTDCVVTAIASLMGYEQVVDLYDKLTSIRNTMGNGSSVQREELYKNAIYYLLKQLTEDKIFNEMADKRQILQAIGSRKSPLLSNDWNLNRLAVAYNRVSGVGDCILLERTSVGTWDVSEIQIENSASGSAGLRYFGNKIDDFRQNATAQVFVFAVSASEDASTSAMTREARTRQQSYRTINLTTSISTLNGPRAASPVITDVSMAPSSISNTANGFNNITYSHHQSQQTLPTSPFRNAHPRFSAHYPSPTLDDERLAVLFEYDQSRADAISAEYHSLADEFAVVSSEDAALASNTQTYVGSDQGVQRAERMQGIAARVLGLREGALQGFGHVLASEEIEARGRQEAARWAGILEGVGKEVQRRKAVLGGGVTPGRENPPTKTAYQWQVQPQHQQRQVVSRFRELDLAETQPLRSELGEASPQTLSFAARIGVRQGYHPVKQHEEAELDQGDQHERGSSLDQSSRDGRDEPEVRRTAGLTVAEESTDVGDPI